MPTDSYLSDGWLNHQSENDEEKILISQPSTSQDCTHELEIQRVNGETFVNQAGRRAELRNCDQTPGKTALDIAMGR